MVGWGMGSGDCARVRARAGQFDALCLLLKDPHGPTTVVAEPALARWPAAVAAEPGQRAARTPQYEALRDWLLEVTTGLLDPREMDRRPGSAESTRAGERRLLSKNGWHSTVALLAPPRLTPSSSQEDRFRYVGSPPHPPQHPRTRSCESEDGPGTHTST
jgi:hypothetical protein